MFIDFPRLIFHRRYVNFIIPQHPNRIITIGAAPSSSSTCQSPALAPESAKRCLHRTKFLTHNPQESIPGGSNVKNFSYEKC
jgi:hypothetical protein